MKGRYYPVYESHFISDIQPHIIRHYKHSGRFEGISHYQFFSAVLYLLKTGIARRDIPAFYGNWHTIYNRFNRWSENGLFLKLLC